MIFDFTCFYDAARKLWHFTDDVRPHGCDILTSCERNVILPSARYLAVYAVGFSELEMHTSNIFCLQCCTLGQLAFDQLWYEYDQQPTNQPEKER